MDIKESLINKIKRCPAPPFLFVGSGLSQRYLGTPTWIGLLKELATNTHEDDLSYEMYCMEANKRNLENGLEPMVAELIENDFNTKWFKDPKYADSRKKYASLIKEQYSPFKIEIANKFLEASSREFLEESIKEIELLKKVGDRSLAGIITTNYDTLIERVFENYKYNKIIGQEELIFTPFTGISEIYKIHGCCTSPKSIVINNKDYTLFNERNAYLVAKLLTIFLEHPIIFIGYKIGDSNIKEILTSIAKCLPKNKLDLLKDRFIFIEWNDTSSPDSISEYEFLNIEDDKSIVMSKIFVKDFSCIYEALLENKVTYNPRLIKKMKQDIYNVVLTSEPSQTLNVLVDIDDSRLDEVEAVVGFGIMKQLGHKGYDGIESEELFEDVIYNNKDFISSLIIEKSLPLILKYNQSIPIHKYLVDYKKDIPQKLIKIKDKKYDSILTKTTRRNQCMGYGLTCSIETLKDKYGLLGAIKYVPEILKDKINIYELHSYIKEIMDEYPDLLKGKNCTNKSGLKKLILIYDYLNYKKED